MKKCMKILTAAVCAGALALAVAGCASQPPTTNADADAAPLGQTGVEVQPGDMPEGYDLWVHIPEADREDGCLYCHGAEDFRPMADDHEGRTNDTCLSCHGTSVLNPSSTGAPYVPHNVDDSSAVDWANE